jgi:hypothetical protein
MVPPRTPAFRRHMGPATAPGFGVAPSLEAPAFCGALRHGIGSGDAFPCGRS